MMTRFRKHFVDATERPRCDVEPEAMESFGIDNLCRLAKLRSQIQHGGKLRLRHKMFRRELPELLRDNGDHLEAGIQIDDGYAIYRKKDFPGLDHVLEESDKFITERGGQDRTQLGRNFLRDLLRPGDLESYTSFLNFATSSTVLVPVCEYMKMIPRLSDLIPPGIRLTESTIKGQRKEGDYSLSQLYHLDFHDAPVVYVIVLLRDVGPANGPFVFLPKAKSAKVKRAIGYGKRTVSFRVSDEQMNQLIDPGDTVTFEGERGDILFLESNACYHFGSRDCHVPRYQLMLAYVSPCRTDFADLYMPRKKMPTSLEDSRLCRMLCSPL